MRRTAARRRSVRWGIATVILLGQAEPRAGLARQDLERAAAPVIALAASDSIGATQALPPVDVRARFEAFQRGFAEEFGVEAPGREEPDLGVRVGEALARRWEGSRVLHWYTRVAGTYERLEAFYQRIERSTRWATDDFAVVPDMEAVIDGKLRLHVEREVGLFDMGLDVDDAAAGNLGLRLGGTIRGYKISFDVDDVVDAGRVGFQLRRVTP